MKPGLHRARGSRRATVAALVTLLVILAPVCRALCVEPNSGAAPAASTGMAAADCHGMAISAEADDPDASSSCCVDEDRQTTQDRHQPAPSALVAILAPPVPDPSDRIAVAFRHRLDPGLHAQGPPLRFLTLRFIE
jgi:hypothetical protein